MTAGSPAPAVSWLDWVIQLRDMPCPTGTVQATVSLAEHSSTAEIGLGGGNPLAA
ncbi:hypothetical protein [Streptomyces sp. NPDC088135]